MAHEAWAGTVAIASIALACAVYYTATAWFEHRERMARIQQGIDKGDKDNTKESK